MKIAHVVNTLEIKEKHKWDHLHIAQDVTLETMSYAKQSTCHSEVELFSIKNKQDNFTPPPEFICLPDMERNCSDVFPDLPSSRDYPLIGDIVTPMIESSDADIFIVTNVDISVFPTFYDFVYKHMLRHDIDCLTINRRDVSQTIDGRLIDVNTVIDDLPEIKKMCKPWHAYHPGTDCFAFTKEIAKDLIWGNVFVGRPPVGRMFLKNGYKFTKKGFHNINKKLRNFHRKVFKEHGVAFPGKHFAYQTFHLGTTQFKGARWRNNKKLKKDPWYVKNIKAYHDAWHD